METKTADATLSTRTLLWIRPVHIDREAKEDDHDRFEKRKGEKLDETRGGKCLEKIFKEREKSGCKKDSIKLEQGKT